MSDQFDAGGAAMHCRDENAGEVLKPLSDARISTDVIAGLFEWEARQGNHVSHDPDVLRRLFHHHTARHDSITWILKVHAYYQFSPVTAILAVNYLDRFLSSCPLPSGGWAYQLIAVACLALASKIEEVYPPSIIELQATEEPGHLFDPPAVQKMELVVMAGLNWRLSVVTPFDFRDYFVSKLPSSGTAIAVASTFTYAVMNSIKVVDFLKFPPSVIAAAAAILATGNTAVEFADTFYEKVNKEMVGSCHQLMEEYLVDTCPSANRKVESMVAAPPSPAGVLDSTACVTCDICSGNAGPASRRSCCCGGGYEPEQKRLRLSVGN